MSRPIALLIFLALVTAALFWWSAPQPGPPPLKVVPPPAIPEKSKTDPLPAAVKNDSATQSAPAPEFVEFTSNEMTDKMVLEVSRMVRPNRVIAGIESTPTGRVAFVAVDGEERVYDMEQDLLPQYEAIMKDLGLKPATGIATRVLSRYRSVSKTAMKFDEQRDRMVVIVSPSIDWPKLRLPKPMAVQVLAPEK